MNSEPELKDWNVDGTGKAVGYFRNLTYLLYYSQCTD